jgi:hypothetical protein
VLTANDGAQRGAVLGATVLELRARLGNGQLVRNLGKGTLPDSGRVDPIGLRFN